MRHFLPALVLLAAIPGIVRSQPNGKTEPTRPALVAHDGQTAKPLTLAKADIHVVISGFLAETTMTLTFHNDGSRVMEGELVFPLPQGATVSGYGLDVNGQIVEGVPVEKQKARITFETEVRKGVDPGIVEHVAGNNYRTRIYPIPARGDRTVRIQYVSDLVQDKDGVSYTLPMNWGDQPVGEYHLKVELVNAPGEAILSGGAARDLQLGQAGNRLITEKTYQNARFADDLVIALPRAAAQHVLVEKFRGENTEQEYFFVVNDLPKVPMIKRTAIAPKRIGILWDASLSRADADKSRELALIKMLLGGRETTPVDVVVFRNEPERPIEIAAGRIDELLKTLESVKYDGATNLADIHIAKNPRQLPFLRPWEELPPNYDFWLMFTDGLGNMMGDMPKSVEAPVYVFSNDSRANHALLDHLARSSGGQYFNLKRDGDERIMPAVGYGSFSLISVEFNADEIADVYPRGVQPIRGRVAIAGKLRAPEAQITLNYGFGTQVMDRQTFTLKRQGASDTNQAARFWAQQKVDELSVFPEKNHDQLLALGREFCIVTPNTSLMVLERLDQYLQYRITPPRSRPDIYAAYMTQIDKQQTEKKKSADQKLDAVVKMWGERVKWWEQKYQYAADFKYVPPPQQREARGGATTRPAEGIVANHRMARTNGAGEPRPVAPAAERPAAADREMNLSPTLRIAGGGVARPSVASSTDEVEKALPAGAGASITVRGWDPETPYLIAMKKVGVQGAYDEYLKQRKTFGAAPAFYLDCADYLLKNEQRELGVRVLTDVIELELESAPLLRIAAHRLAQIGQLNLAVDLFEKVLSMRPEEPQSHRDLALALVDRAEQAMKAAGPLSERTRNDLVRAMDLLNKVVLGTWDGRFPEIEVVALMEFNRLIAKVRADDRTRDIAVPLDSRLVKLLDLDVRISLTWDADATDIDLWVTEPSGEKCYYGHTRTTIGGLISKDFTQGYGPEEYCLRRLMAGTYNIQANFFGSSQQKLTGPTTIQATIFTDYGRPNEKRQSITLRLVGQKETIDVGTVKLGGQ